MLGSLISKAVGTTPAIAVTIPTDGAQNCTLHLKNTGATDLNSCTLYSRSHPALGDKCLRNGTGAWTGVAFKLDGTAGNPTVLAAGDTAEIRFQTIGSPVFEIWCGVASSTTTISAFWSTDRTS